MPPKHARILKTINVLEGYLTKLKKAQAYKLDDFKADWNKYFAVERLIQLSVESIIDIGEDVIGIGRFKKPEIYRETFIILAQEKVIDFQLSKKLQNLVDFRNKLVHAYTIVPLERIYQIYTKDLECVDSYLKAIKEFVAGHKS